MDEHKVKRFLESSADLSFAESAYKNGARTIIEELRIVLNDLEISKAALTVEDVIKKISAKLDTYEKNNR